MSQYASMYGSGNSPQETNIQLDKDRYYYASINGPGAEDARPKLKITFSAPKTAER